MEPDLGRRRRQAHELLVRLPAEKLNAVRSLLEVMVEPLSRSPAPAPDEEITPELAAALRCARTSLARGGITPHEEMLRESGLDHLPCNKTLFLLDRILSGCYIYFNNSRGSDLMIIGGQASLYDITG